MPGPCGCSALAGEVKHREVKQPVTMNSPALTPAFHQFLETLLREKKPTKKPKAFSLSAQQSISFSVPWACHHTQGLWLLCWDSARALPGSSSWARGVVCPQAVCHCAASEGLCRQPRAWAPLQLSGQSTPVRNALLQPLTSFHEGRGCSFPTGPEGPSPTSGVCQQR